MSTVAVQYQVMKQKAETILVVKISRLDEENFGKIAESIVEKVKSRLYKNITLLLGEDVDPMLLEELRQILESLGIRTSIVKV